MVKNYHSLAETIRAAYSTGPIEPMRRYLDPADGEGAYAVQELNTKWWQSQGRLIVGRKIGLTAKSVQEQLGVDQPDFGILFDDMRIPDGGTLKCSKVLQPKAEGEVAVGFNKDLAKPDATMDDVVSAIGYVAPAIEIVDSRVADWKITFADTVADNGSSGYFVVGDKCEFSSEVDLWSCGMVLQVNGEIRSVGAGAACLGHPLEAVHWLVRFLAGRGQKIREGEVILTGALGPMVSLTPGDAVRVSVGGLGEVAFTFGTDD